MQGYVSSNKIMPSKRAKILGGACLIAGFAFAPSDVFAYEYEESNESFLNKGKGTNFEDTRFYGIKQYPIFKKGKSEYKNISLPEEKSIGFYQEVSRFSDLSNLSIAKVSALLNVERKSIYDWKKNPEVSVREKTKERLFVFDDFLQSIEPSHRGLVFSHALKKMDHALPQVEESLERFRSVILKREISKDEILSAYDDIWNEIEKQRFLSVIKKEKFLRG